MIEINNKDFNKIITDLIKDLALVFPDVIQENKNSDIINILKYIDFEFIVKKEYDVIKKDNSDENIEQYNLDEQNTEIVENYKSSCNNLLLYCLEHYPKYFFEIIYKNNNLFENMDYQKNYDDLENNQDNSEKEERENNEQEENDEENIKEYNTYFLPDIDFKILFNDSSISNKTRETLWNYLQLILITIISNIDSEHTFGDAAKLFEAVESEKLFSQFSNIIDNVKNMHSSIDEQDISDNSIFNSFKNIFDFSSNLENLPDISNLQQHLNGILDGKIGKLAAEFSEDLYKEFNIENIENENIQNINDVYKVLFKNPKKLFNVISKMGDKLDEKIKSGELSQREIIEESTKMFGSLTNTDISGMDGMQIFKDMVEGFANNNKNFNKSAFNNMMSKEKMRSRMRDKLNKKHEQNENKNEEKIDDEKMKNNLFDLLKDESKDLRDLNTSLAQLMQNLDGTINNKSKKPKSKKPKKKH